MKEITLGVRISQETSEQLKNLAEQRDIPVSQIVREAIREKVSDLETANGETETALAK